MPTFRLHPLAGVANPRSRWIRCLAWLPVLAAPWASAQLVALDARPEFASYVIGEPLMVRVSLANHGAQPIVIGDHEAFRDNRIFMEIRRNPHETLPVLRPEPILGEVDLENGEVLAVTVDLGEWYPLLEAGRYYFNVVLLHNNRRYASDQRVFDIVPGIELARLVQVVRGSRIVERAFTLVYWARNDREDAFLRVVDQPDNLTWTTLALGPIVRVAKPELKQVDEATISVFQQASRDVLMTSIIRSDADGPVLVQQRPTVDAVSSPLINTLGDALEKTPGGRPRRRSR
ncbi:MAG: hypothetical protein GX590_06405 [Lentisphaerae bacterium]|nr:hypothetical protein [Lentisphaerota bacterium]